LWRAAARSTGAASGRTAATRTTTWTTARTTGSSAWSTVRRGGATWSFRSDDQWTSSRLSHRGGGSGGERLGDGDHRSGRSLGRSTKAGSHDDLGSFLPLRRDLCEILFTESLGSGGRGRFVEHHICGSHLCNGVAFRLGGFDHLFSLCCFGRSLDRFWIFGDNFGFRGAGCFFDRVFHDHGGRGFDRIGGGIFRRFDRGFYDRSRFDRGFYNRGFYDRSRFDRGFYDHGFYDRSRLDFRFFLGGHDFTRCVGLLSRFRRRDFLGFFGNIVGNGDDS
jgi:hypothetical protein